MLVLLGPGFTLVKVAEEGELLRQAHPFRSVVREREDGQERVIEVKSEKRRRVRVEVPVATDAERRARFLEDLKRGLDPDSFRAVEVEKQVATEPFV
jgi:hypothetical protein